MRPRGLWALLGGLRRTLGGGRGEVTVEVRGRVDGVKPRQKIKGIELMNDG